MTGIIPCLYNSYSFSKENFEGGNIVCYDIARRVVGCEREREKSKQPENIIIQALLPEPIFLKKKEDSDSESSEINTSSSSSESESEASSPTVEITVFQPNDIKQYAYNNTRTNETANTDSILWSLYIMLYGVEKYEMIENHYIESNRFKFELIEFLRDNKTILKANKVKLSSTEDTLVHKPFITLETLHAVAICKSLSLYIIQDRKYYDVSSGSGSGSGTPFILEKIKGKYLLYMPPDPISMKYIAYVRANYWRMESISAPIRPISAYKLQDLIDISEKLNLPVVNIFPGKFGSIGTEKRKTKPELYEAICRYV
jgi:hypothetical protein